MLFFSLYTRTYAFQMRLDFVISVQRLSVIFMIVVGLHVRLILAFFKQHRQDEANNNDLFKFLIIHCDDFFLKYFQS